MSKYILVPEDELAENVRLFLTPIRKVTWHDRSDVVLCHVSPPYAYRDFANGRSADVALTELVGVCSRTREGELSPSDKTPDFVNILAVLVPIPANTADITQYAVVFDAVGKLFLSIE